MKPYMYLNIAPLPACTSLVISLECSSFYLAAPLPLCADCALDVFYFLVNLVTKFIVVGKDHMPPVEVELWQVVNPLIRLGWRHWIGAAVFFWGWIHQQRCHKILGSLRNSRQAEEYAIPHGDWFEIVSSPHYLSEMEIKRDG